ncbi:hypothetical protein ACRE4Z_001546 [Enterococcus hirae]
MTTKTKNLHFFRLELLRLTEDRNGDSVMSPLSIKEKNIYLDDLVKNHLNSNNALKVKRYDNNSTKEKFASVEIITSNEYYVFGKMGKEQDINQFQIRKNDSLESRLISKESDELFEAFSYFLIDKKTFAVTYIKEKVAPNISYLSDMFTQEFKDSNKIWGKTIVLMDEDAIDKLSRKKVIGTIEYELTLPAGTHKEITGLSEDEYILLQNQKHIKTCVKLVTDSRKNSVFDSYEKAKEFFSKFKSKNINLKVKAKDDEDDIMQEFKLLNDNFTKKAKFNYDTSKTANDLQEEIESQMWIQFKKNESDILSYI